MQAQCWNIAATPQANVVNSTYFGLLAEFGEANIPLEVDPFACLRALIVGMMDF
jgi:hypothetical protein